jgi:hypothetical protein
VSHGPREELEMGLYQEILKERAKEGYCRYVHPMLRFYVGNGARSMGCGIRFASLNRRYPEDYSCLMEVHLQDPA